MKKSYLIFSVIIFTIASYNCLLAMDWDSESDVSSDNESNVSYNSSTETLLLDMGKMILRHDIKKHELSIERLTHDKNAHEETIKKLTDEKDAIELINEDLNKNVSTLKSQIHNAQYNNVMWYKEGHDQGKKEVLRNIRLNDTILKMRVRELARSVRNEKRKNKDLQSTQKIESEQLEIEHQNSLLREYKKGLEHGMKQGHAHTISQAKSQTQTAHKIIKSNLLSQEQKDKNPALEDLAVNGLIGLMATGTAIAIILEFCNIS